MRTPVDQGAVRRSKVSRNVSVGAWSDAGVFAADVAVVDGDRAFGESADGGGVLAEADSFTGWEHQRSGTDAAGGPA